MSKKVGKACERNFFKRRLRNALHGVSLPQDIFILGIVLKKHSMDFKDEKAFLHKKFKLFTYPNNVAMHTVL